MVMPVGISGRFLIITKIMQNRHNAKKGKAGPVGHRMGMKKQEAHPFV